MTIYLSVLTIYWPCPTLTSSSFWRKVNPVSDFVPLQSFGCPSSTFLAPQCDAIHHHHLFAWVWQCLHVRLRMRIQQQYCIGHCQILSRLRCFSLVICLYHFSLFLFRTPLPPLTYFFLSSPPHSALLLSLSMYFTSGETLRIIGRHISQ